MSYESSIIAGFRAGILAVRLDGKVLYLNSIGERILSGWKVEPGDSIHALAGENTFFRLISESLTLTYLPTRLEVELPTRGGERMYVGFTLSSMKEGDRQVGICAVFKDLTQVEIAEENENLKQRLVLLGQMAAGLAHEIRNPIASIGVHLAIVRKQLDGADERIRTSISLMEREISKVEYIIKECLGFVRPADLGLQRLSLPPFLDGIARRFREMFPSMEVNLHLPADRRLEVEVDPGLVEQALVNILSNAADACGGKGKVDILVGRSRHFSGKVLLIRRSEPLLPMDPGKETDWARITIRDNGPGIPEEIREKIFVPFFTTKKSGTGIGLALAQKIIHSHGGVIDLRSSLGEGTEFILKIPLRSDDDG